ncbi:hypothetical protein AG1IA_09686 [Rhizoctonia solani AG-1 IA]|uniref:Uncharacterized protein n=1 Tax=Thanatephorus cucumeris (strain AG1-IA) TaxID=983506 RepID=L8WIX5_THACA|nr:hypothetical protein AG1IA_09686 [Rhizoctonia solani AG-1 IA]
MRRVDSWAMVSWLAVQAGARRMVLHNKLWIEYSVRQHSPHLCVDVAILAVVTSYLAGVQGLISWAA